MSQKYAQKIADDLVTQLDEWYSLPETFDDELERQLHRWYADAPKLFPKRPYFSPSAADADPRELYYKALRYPKDKTRKQPHQGRWAEIGTEIGSIMQRTILAMERNLEKKIGIDPLFRFERTDNGEPMFEDFAKRNVEITHDDKTFYLFGTCDGVMEYLTEDDEILRVGLEVKSKQTTNARTSHYSLQAPQASHAKQCYVYSMMYDLDYYVILYVNTSHKGWKMSEEDYEKTPDIRAFGLHITDEDRNDVLDKFASVLDDVENRTPAPLDLEKFTFNNFKSAIANDLTKEEFEGLQRQALKAQNSSLPKFVVRNYTEAIEEIETLREEE